MKTKIFAAALGLALLSIPALAKDKVTTHQVHFDKGTNGTTVKGHVKGYDTVYYKLGAKAGQSMHVSLRSKKAFMNIFEPGKGAGDGAMFGGSSEGGKYRGVLPESGTYTIQVFLMRNEARRGTNTSYTLEIGID
ncbi:MAG: hypothetical protein J7J02_04415 [Sulfurovum sp.]|nr:hypothetical protein [Sulfurovum sp.]